jgi:hypothetical protein
MWLKPTLFSLAALAAGLAIQGQVELCCVMV